jgi:hypothetical protein
MQGVTDLYVNSLSLQIPPEPVLIKTLYDGDILPFILSHRGIRKPHRMFQTCYINSVLKVMHDHVKT